MKILGIDYGRAKIGLAISEGQIAEPWKVVRVGSMEDACKKVVQVVAGLPAVRLSSPSKSGRQVEQVVVGVSDGEMGEEQKQFAHKLAEKLEIPVETWDETLSTQEAQSRAISAGVPQKRRRELEDAFAATVMLQSYLDQYGEDTSSV